MYVKPHRRKSEEWGGCGRALFLIITGLVLVRAMNAGMATAGAAATTAHGGSPTAVRWMGGSQRRCAMKAEKAWCVTFDGSKFLDSLRETRRASWAAFCGSHSKVEREYWYRRGYRCVKVTVHEFACSHCWAETLQIGELCDWCDGRTPPGDADLQQALAAERERVGELDGVVAEIAQHIQTSDYDYPQQVADDTYEYILELRANAKAERERADVANHNAKEFAALAQEERERAERAEARLSESCEKCGQAEPRLCFGCAEANGAENFALRARAEAAESHAKESEAEAALWHSVIVDIAQITEMPAEDPEQVDCLEVACMVQSLVRTSKQWNKLKEWLRAEEERVSIGPDADIYAPECGETLDIVLNHMLEQENKSHE